MNKKPNILLFFPDQHRGDWTELNINLPVKTPNLKKIADEGVVFTNMISPAPLCSPARSCFAVGKEYDNVDILDNGQNHPFDHPTFYELLRDKAGYHTMTCGKLDLRHPEHSYGRDGKHIVDGEDFLEKWGFSEGIENGGKYNGVKTYKAERKKIGPYIAYLEDKGIVDIHINDFKNRTYKTVRPTELEDEDYADNWIGRCGADLLKNAPKDKPWFLQINFNGPHAPMDVTKSMREKWKNVTNFPQPIDSTIFTEEENIGIRQNYSAMVENIDRWIAIFIDEVKKRGELDNTIIIYTSDHGEMLGDHGLIRKFVPWQPSINVPFFAKGPGIKHQDPIAEPASLIDLFSTFLDFAEVDIPNNVDSVSLKKVFEAKEKQPVRYVRSGLWHFRVILKYPYKLVVGKRKRTNWKIKLKRSISSFLKGKISKKSIYWDPIELYNIKKDPWELHNIADQHPDIVEELKKI